jgi:predicted nucleotidyltransferase
MESVIGHRRAAYARALDEALRRVLAQLSERAEVRRVILFGSYAAGRRDLFTDLDLLVVMDSDQPFVSRTAALHRDTRAGVDVDFLVYTPAEFERMRLRPFLRRILETGRVLLER